MSFVSPLLARGAAAAATAAAAASAPRSLVRARAAIAVPAAGVAAAVVAGTPPPGARGYFSRPVPTRTVEEVRVQLTSPRNRTRASVKPGMPMTEIDRVAAGLARRTGFLVLRAHCTQAAADAHFRYCCTTRRPYLALNRDGSELVVDLLPVGGIARTAKHADIERVTSALSTALAGAPQGTQVVNLDSLAAQRSENAPASLTAANGGKSVDTALGDKFTVYSPGRPEGFAVARALVDAYRATLGMTPLAQVEEERAARGVAKTAHAHKLRVRQLLRLVADPDAVRQLRVKAGAVDGFVQAVAEGREYTVPPQ
jgi:hypothetical protein